MFGSRSTAFGLASIALTALAGCEEKSSPVVAKPPSSSIPSAVARTTSKASLPTLEPDFYIYDEANNKVAMCFGGVKTHTEAVFLVKTLNGSQEPVLLKPGRYFIGAPHGTHFPEKVFGPNVAALEFPIDKPLIIQDLRVPLDELAKEPDGKS